jgi:N4-gp56 family major capsid protein
MGDIVTNVTDKGVIDGHEVTIFEQGAILGYTPELVVDQVATVRRFGVNAKVVQFPTYTTLTLISAAITDGEDVATVAMADSTYTLTPLEYGNAITLQKSANIESGGAALLAAGELIGRNAGASKDKLGMTAAEAFSTTRIYPGSATAASELSESAVLDKTFANRLHNKLARLNIPTISGGLYVGIAHDDCLYDLRNDAGSGGWTDVSKYADPQTVLRNEVGTFAGIRWLRSSNVTATDASWGTTGDSYKINVFGFNAFGLAEAIDGAVQIIIKEKGDPLNRFVTIGWKWNGVYGVLDTSNMVQGIVASSIGNNAA